MHTARQSHNGAKNVGDTERVVSGMVGTALLFAGLQRRSTQGLALAALGGLAIQRALTGKCAVYQSLGLDTACHGAGHKEEIKIEHAVSIRRPREEVYRFWRRLENLPRIMSKLKDVTVGSDGTSHWSARGPLGKELNWDATIINEVNNELIAWRSLPDSELSNAGSVRFEDGTDGLTHLRVSMAYTPPGGKIGETVAAFLGENPQEQLRDDLNRFKEFMDAQQDRVTVASRY